MIETVNPKGLSPAKRMESILLFSRAQLRNEKNLTANLANLSAIIALYMEDLNWAGFYLMNEGELVLGPFQGKPACNRIAIGSGVCGTAVAEGKTQRVDDVLALDNHIACDAASRSELVVPIRQDGEILGVLDLDSPSLARFTDLEQSAMEELVRLLEETL
ncbi:GAF domain-containing protein [Proteiniclasticum sediminis]